MSTGEVESFNFILKFLSSTSEAISIKYLELKLITNSSASQVALSVSLPSPEFVLITDNFILSLLISNFTPSFLSSETVATLSIDSIKSLVSTFKFLLLSIGTTFL